MSIAGRVDVSVLCIDGVKVNHHTGELTASLVFSELQMIATIKQFLAHISQPEWDALVAEAESWVPA